MKLPSLLKITTEAKSSSSPWPWPSCHQPKTHSFRATNNNNTFKTINSASYLDTTTMDMLESSEPFFTVSPHSASFSSASEQQSNKRADSIETVIRGLRSDRLFFEPDETSSILEAKAGSLPFKDSVVLSLESQDPFLDFRRSMEEMVTAHAEVHDDDVSTPSSSLLLEQVREEINHEEDVASSSSSSNI
ncbi:Ovate protein family, C-terminal [Sesbania bispinosa]|nr:Ovate protein family, C-terminal [Sesbania bispinosa]